MWGQAAMRRLVAATFVAALGVAGCGDLRTGVPAGEPVAPKNPDQVGPMVQIAAGVTAAGTWRAWVYRTKDGSVCIEYAGGESGGATYGPEDSVMPPSTSVSNREAFVIGGTADRSAAGAVIRLASGATMRVPLVPVGTVSKIGARYYVASVPLEDGVVEIDIVDAAGTVVETTTLTTK
jgi:hypothetical protein